MSINRIDPNQRMSAAVVHNGIVYLSGQVAKNHVGKSVTEQTGEILSIIDGLFEKAGTDKSKLLTTSIWLSDISTFAEMNTVWESWIPAGGAPARATVEARLASPDYKVEIAMTAAV